MRYFYKFLSFIFHYILPFVIWYRVFVGKEDNKRYREKFGKYGDFKRPAGFLVRIHGASLGETMAALPFIKELLKQRPHITVLVTSGTKTSADMLKKYMTERVLHLYAPLDTPQICKRFYTYIKPDLEIIIDSEIWVNSLGQAKNHHIPVFGLNTRISQKSQRLWSYCPDFFRSILECYQGFFVQNDETAKMIASYYDGFIRVCTNLKWALEELDYNEEALSSLQTQLQNRPVIVAMSTHEGEEEYIIKSFEKVRFGVKSNPLLIIVPRHPQRAMKISVAFADYHPALRSKGDVITDNTILYIADTVGEVGLWSHLATILLIGKAFCQRGEGIIRLSLLYVVYLSFAEIICKILLKLLQISKKRKQF